MKKILCVLFLLAVCVATLAGLHRSNRQVADGCANASQATKAALPESAFKGHKPPPRCGESPQTVIEGIKRSSRKNKRIFSAAQFICILPMHAPALTTVCTGPAEAVAAVLRMKAEGYEEIRLRTPVSGPVYDAIIRTARENDIRVNV